MSSFILYSKCIYTQLLNRVGVEEILILIHMEMKTKDKFDFNLGVKARE